MKGGYSAVPNERPAASCRGITSIARNASIILQLVLIYIPLRAVLYAFAPLRPQRQWSFIRSIVVSTLQQEFSLAKARRVYRGRIDKSTLPLLSSSQKAEATPVWIAPLDPARLRGEMKDMFQAVQCTTKQFPAFWYGEGHKSAGNGVKGGERVFLYFHGGGYIEESAHPSSPVVEHARVLLAGAKASSDESAPRRLLAPEYRLSDETSFPGILADAYASWLYLIGQCGFVPSNVTIAGDSAGGNLALALARYICREHSPSLPARKRFEPIADSLVLFSPWVDLSLSHLNGDERASAVKNRSTDFLALNGLIGARDAAVYGLPTESIQSPYMSSIRFGQEHDPDLFKGFPRALLFYGGLEGFADECKTLQQVYNAGFGKMDEARMTAFEEPLGTHDFCALPSFAEERKRCIKRVSDWI